MVESQKFHPLQFSVYVCEQSGLLPVPLSVSPLSPSVFLFFPPFPFIFFNGLIFSVFYLLT